MYTKSQIQALIVEKASKARGIAIKAHDAGREFTDGEKADIRRLLDEVADHQRDLDRMNGDAQRSADRKSADDALRASLAGLDYPTGGSVGAGMQLHGGSQWGRKAAEKIMATARAAGVKALVSGSIDVPSVVEPAVELPGRPTRILDLIPHPQPLAGNTFEYLRQTVRTNNAAPVPDGGTKPTSIFTVQEIEDRARVVAHLTEPMPERYLADAPELAGLLDSQLRAGVMEAFETEIVSGDGTGEHFTGILSTSGVTAVPFATDVLTTLRKARTALETLNEVPTAWMLHPTDLEAIDLIKATVNGEYLVNSSALANIFGDLPRISSTAVPVGTAILADWRQSRVWPREEMRIDADRSGDNFTKNLVTLRGEARFGWGILRPQSFAVVDLTA